MDPLFFKLWIEFKNGVTYPNSFNTPRISVYYFITSVTTYSTKPSKAS